ncbi:MAG TPA: peptidylprolyl isomerase, partial [Candidatus Nanoarchaeia archaeon]|nr:peptidylprolyl isomerase [Candidatus Nanoarchaeia archaeon]
MTQIEKGNFVELEYTGTIMGENIVFDTTSIDVAKKNGIFNPHAKYGPATVCIGAGQLLPGLDADIIGKEIGKDYAITLKPTQAFGDKDPELLNLIPLESFDDAKQLEAGMQVQVDDKIGTIQSISGGRVVVDFNHPLSGRP